MPGLTIQQAANDLLSKLGIEGTDPTVAPTLAQQDVIIALNWAGQTLQRAGQDYFTRATLTVGLSAGTSMYAIAQPIQEVLGPIRLNGQVPLNALLSRGELDQFARIFLGETIYGTDTGVPIAYWVEYLNNQAGQGDIEQINIYLAPTPGALGPVVPLPGTIVVECVYAWTNYAVASIGSTNVLPIARLYTESIFLPLARRAITRSSQFSRKDLLAQIEADGDVAMQTLGTGGGFPNVLQPEPERRVTA